MALVVGGSTTITTKKGYKMSNFLVEDHKYRWIQWYEDSILDIAEDLDVTEELAEMVLKERLGSEPRYC